MKNKTLPLLAALLSPLAVVAAQPTAAPAELQLIVDAAEAATTQGQWSEARQRWQLALNKLAAVDDEYRAVVYYEHGRSAGVMCDWAQAESSLQQALELDRKTDGPYFMSLLELARLQLAQRHYPQAKDYFDQVLPELHKHHAAVVDPLSTAAILDDYAAVLVELGAAAEAATFKQRAAALRQPQEAAAAVPATPYGRGCQ